ncbi:MAG: SDR family oxidoreductase [Patescibacteria group bacterium]
MTERFSLKGKNAVLTGAAGFFGRYFARALLEEGAGILLIDHKGEKLHELEEELRKDFPRTMISHYTLDHYDHDRAWEIITPFYSNYNFHVLINNAFDFSERTGFNDKTLGCLEKSTYEQFRSCMESGVYWAWQMTQIFGFKMKRMGAGSIINICSMYGLVVPDPKLYDETSVFNPPGYSVAKAALLHFTKRSAVDLGPEVRVNAISPGAIPNLESKTNNPPNKIVLSRLKEKIILQRMGHPTDLVGALIFLASDASSYMTGQNIVVDGGFTIT